MDDEPFDILSDQRLARSWRIALILLGLAALGGGALFGFATLVGLGISYAHDSSPTPEFRAAGDAEMMLALALVLFGTTCLFCRRAKHLLMVGTAAIALLLCAGIAAWCEKVSRHAEQPYAIALVTTLPPHPKN